jgi:hypothetical protein
MGQVRLTPVATCVERKQNMPCLTAIGAPRKGTGVWGIATNEIKKADRAGLCSYYLTDIEISLYIVQAIILLPCTAYWLTFLSNNP